MAIIMNVIKKGITMKICVTSEGNNLGSKVDPRFGRCKYFIIVDPETLNFNSIQNPNLETSGGAGIQSAQLVANNEVKAVVTGNVGPNAFQTLNAAGIAIFNGASGTVKEAIEKYKKGEYQLTSAPNAASKSGTTGIKELF